MISMNLDKHVSERRVIAAALEIDTIDHATQYATVRYNGRAFATISRARVYAKGGKVWTVTDTTGALLFEANFAIEFANDAFRRRLVSIIHDMERPDREPGKSEIAARVADESGIPVIDMPVSEVAAADLSGMPELIELAERAAAPVIETGLTGPDWEPDDSNRYYAQQGKKFEFGPTENAARAALTRAVNASIAAGNPVFVNMPASQPAADYMAYRELASLPEYVRPEYKDGYPVQQPGALHWTGKDAPPAIGTEILVTINSCGLATVTGYFCEGGFLGLMCRLHNAPEWHVKQNKGNPNGHVFGPEFRAV